MIAALYVEERGCYVGLDGVDAWPESRDARQYAGPWPEQGHFGHRARKATWLYACRVELPSLPWGKSQATMRLDSGHHSAEERKRGRLVSRDVSIELMGRRERLATPLPFRDLLIGIARSVHGEGLATQ